MSILKKVELLSTFSFKQFSFLLKKKIDFPSSSHPLKTQSFNSIFSKHSFKLKPCLNSRKRTREKRCEQASNNKLKLQTRYWLRVRREKEFTHPTTMEDAGNWKANPFELLYAVAVSLLYPEPRRWLRRWKVIFVHELQKGWNEDIFDCSLAFLPAFYSKLCFCSPLFATLHHHMHKHKNEISPVIRRRRRSSKKISLNNQFFWDTAQK